MFRVSGFRLLDFYCFRILELEVLGLRVSGILGLRVSSPMLGLYGALGFVALPSCDLCGFRGRIYGVMGFWGFMLSESRLLRAGGFTTAFRRRSNRPKGGFVDTLGVS